MAADPDAASALLGNRYPGVRRDGERVLVPLPEREAAAAIAFLYEAGLPVCGLPMRTPTSSPSSCV